MNPETLPSTDGLIRSLDRLSLDQPCPSVQLLKNEQMVTMITAAGSGYVQNQGQSITRWRPDPTRDTDGYFIYVRDLESSKYWSATYQPTNVEPDNYQVDFRLGSARFIRLDGGVRTELEVFLAPDENVEFRRVTLTNLGSTSRNLELTSYAEVVLQDAQADAGHLAYSKLFVETSRHASGALCAKRRPRSSGDSTVSACHFLAGTTDRETAPFETDRARFLGRGNSGACPDALVSPAVLEGRLGSVLDPVFSLRKNVHLPSNESVCLTFALAAGNEATDYSDLIQKYESPESVALALVGAESTENGFQFRCDDLPGLLASAASTLYCIPNTEIEPLIGQARFFQHFGIEEPTETPTKKIDGPTDRVIEQPEESGTQSINETVNPREILDDVWPPNFDEALQHDNGLAGFSADGSEYVVRLRSVAGALPKLPPMPWANIISNEHIGFITTETGAGYTWAGNSRLNRLTPWHNDPIADPHGEVVYLRDEEAQTLWSVTPGPVVQPVDYEVRHGIGYSRYRHTSNGFDHELIRFVPIDDPVKITWVRLKNNSDRTRSISLASYVQWDLSDGNWEASSATDSSIDSERGIAYATNFRRGVFAGNTTFAALVPPADAKQTQLTCDRFEFLGHHGSVSSPQALAINSDLSGRAGSGFDQCAACKTSVEIAPGETREFAVLLGETSSTAEAEQLVEKYSNPAQWPAALQEAKSTWGDRVGAVQVETPSSAINLMVNGWLPYQNLSCRVWGRSSLYQSGGAYGYRDQLQDAAALIHHLPELTRQQIVRHATHQFSEGDVMHWWHPPHSLGIRTMFSDDLLWLPLFAAEYAEATGDESIWDEELPFLSGEQLPAGEPEILLTPTTANETGSLYEHCCRALDHGLTSGRNGLPLMGCGDWNDGMNRVGIGGTGESVWMGFFIDYILGKMLPVCEQLNDKPRQERYLTYREQLRVALHDAGWDGGWYRRAYFDDGTPLGTAAADECQIDALVQAWAVLSGADSSERATKAMEAAADRLVDEQAGLIQLLDPPFDKMGNDPGYIKGYLPGVRENGGQYTHGVLWFVRAMAELGRGSQAAKLLEMITPVDHTNTPEGVATYQAEPYVVAADVYSQAPHAGRAGWSWYTGSAGWMWRVAVESILGVRLIGGNTLRIDPRISSEWPECNVRYRLSDRRTVYEVLIRNPNGRELGVTECELDGTSVPVVDAVANLPLSFDGQTHHAIVTL